MATVISRRTPRSQPRGHHTRLCRRVHVSLEGANRTALGLDADVSRRHQVHQADAGDDSVITLGGQLHIVRAIDAARTVFLYLVIHSNAGNVALARHQLEQLAATMSR